MSSDINGENVEDDVQTAIRIKVKRAYQACDSFPSYLRSLLNFDKAFHRTGCCRIIRRTKIPDKVSGKLRISFRLLAEKIELVLLVAS